MIPLNQIMEVIDAMNLINSTMYTKKCFGEQLKIHRDFTQWEISLI